MRVLFMGTPDFAVGTLQAIIDAGHEVAAVFTQPDKPKGRGKEMVMPPVKEKALEYNLDVYQPVKVKEPEQVDIIRKMNPDVIIVVAFGQIMSQEILDIPKYGCINVHASLLPEYRGAAPIQWAVIDGKEVSGVTTMIMDKGIDTGDMLLQREVPLDKKETGGSLFDKLSKAGAELLVETLKAVEEGTVTRIKQDNNKATHAKMLDKSTGKIDFNQDAVVIERLVRGLNPWPSAYTSLHGKTLKIWDCDVTDREYEGTAGEIVEVNKTDLIVKCGKGALNIRELQLEGKKRMDTESFLRGYSIKKGEIL